jgi:hypothetical protein
MAKKAPSSMALWFRGTFGEGRTPTIKPGGISWAMGISRLAHCHGSPPLSSTLMRRPETGSVPHTAFPAPGEPAPASEVPDDEPGSVPSPALLNVFTREYRTSSITTVIPSVAHPMGNTLARPS